MDRPAPAISVIIPAYNEEENIAPLFKELKAVLEGVGMPYEVIFIDDGSTDSTSSALSLIEDARIRVVRFPQNKGKSAALTCGFRMASGQVVLTMDGDLQDDPKEIPRFIEAIQKHEVVTGWKYRRNDPYTKRLPSLAYNFLTSLLTGVRVHDHNCGFKAYRSYTLKGLTLDRDMHRYVLVFMGKKGYDVGEIIVNHRPRIAGRSKYGFMRIPKGFIGLFRALRMNPFAPDAGDESAAFEGRETCKDAR